MPSASTATDVHSDGLHDRMVHWFDEPTESGCRDGRSCANGRNGPLAVTFGKLTDGGVHEQSDARADVQL